jgi:hypothetical protein
MKKEVRQIPREHAVPWFLEKHYAKRIPSISWAYGLYLDGKLEGVVSYGTPASSTLLGGVCGPENADKVIELNRLILNEGLPKNSASYLVSRSIRMLPHPKIIVSYADTGQGHVGYIYQACNFIYTGLSSPFVDPKVRGLEHQHHATYANGKTNDDLRAEFGDRLYFVDRPRKHRYVYFAGCADDVKNALRYNQEPYPKGESRRYDSGNEVKTNGVLF